MKMILKVAAGCAIAFLLLQCVRSGIPSRPAAAEVQAPPELRRILQKDCYSCHSDQKRLSWFDQIEPAYWFVRKDVLTAREHLNFSTLGAKPAAAQKAALFEAAAMMQLGAMPLPRFTRLHPAAKVTPAELETLKAYLNPWPAPGRAMPAAQGGATGAAVAAAGSGGAATPPAPASLEGVKPEPNGVAFDARFERWKLIGMTERGDNRTLRFILGNDVAVRAAQAATLLPWPDGARLAKIAWRQDLHEDGLIHAGSFVQVELMEKDAKRFKSTDGWGWGRWRGLDLKPYGNDAKFVEECTTCHLPVRGNDAVYTQPITAAHVTRAEVVNNRAAAMPPGLPYQVLGWSVISLAVDPGQKTIAALFGDDQAVQAARARSANPGGARYPAGATLALVTWDERDDPHWFGARIPDTVRSVEFVKIGSDGEPGPYMRFGPSGAEGVPQAEVGRRANLIAGMGVAELP